MKPTNSLILAAFGMLITAGCTITPVALDPVGPAPANSKPQDLASTGEGWLRVHTATEAVPDGDTTYSYPHTGYGIYTADGKLLEYVPNHMANRDESAALVKIRSGNYRVLAHSERYNVVSVPVIIRPGEITEVHLGSHWKAPSTAMTNKLVYSPDGRPVGWKYSLPPSTN